MNNVLAEFAISAVLSSPLAVVIPAASALAITVWLFYHNIGGRGLPGCGLGSGCDAVTRSRWSRWGRVPISGPGAIAYLTVCVAAVFAATAKSIVGQQAAWLVLLAMVPLLTGAALWFMGLQLIVIRRICPYCIVVHALGLFVAASILYGAREFGLHVVAADSFISHHWQVLIPGVGALALLIGGQIVIEPPTYAVMRLSREEPSLPPSPRVPPQWIRTKRWLAGTCR